MTNNLPLQIDYTSRDYESLKADLVKLINLKTNLGWTADNPSDIGTALLESFAYMGDIMSYYIDRVANELNVDTATRRKTLVNLGKLFGYRASGPTPANIALKFTNISTKTLDLPIGTQVLAALSSGDFREIYFETTQAALQLAPGGTVTLTAREGKTVNTDRPDLISPVTNKPLPTNLGISVGSGNQSFRLFDTDVVDNSIYVYVGQGVAFTSWSFVDSLLDSGPSALVFTTSIDESGYTYIEFGDGVNGAIPPAGQVISALYKTSAGVSGNVAIGAVSEVTFIPGNNVPEATTYLSVTNDSASYGGANGDNNTQLRQKVKAAISARRRAITLQDYESLTLLVPQVGKVKAVAGTFSSITLYIQSQDDGTVTPGIVSGLPTSSWNSIATNVVSYLADKIQIGTSITTQYPTYTPIYVTLTVTAKSNYKNLDISRAIRAAFINPGGLMAYENTTFGKDVAYSSVISTAQSIPGVESVIVNKLNTDNSASAPVTGIQIPDNQIATLPTANLIINVSGGLS